jgi:hypothetical protein
LIVEGLGARGALETALAAHAGGEPGELVADAGQVGVERGKVGVNSKE